MERFLWLLILMLFGLGSYAVYGACTVDTSIKAFREDTDEGTVILKIPFNRKEKWEFQEEEPFGYLEMNTTASGDHVITFIQSPDLEEINQKDSKEPVIESLKYTLNCTEDGMTHTYKQSVAIADVNEKRPYFTMSSYATDIDELTMPGSIIFTLNDKAIDDDITGSIALFRLHPYNDSEVDGRGKFSLSAGGREIILTEVLDYDTMWPTGSTHYILNISVQDNGYPSSRVAFTTLAIRITDADDQGPAFVYPKCPLANNFCITPAYIAYVQSNSTGTLHVYPGSIQAEDKDVVKNNILYSIMEVLPPRYTQYFWINSRTGQITQLRNIQGSHNVSLAINAEEISQRRRAISCTLLVLVDQDDRNFKDIPSQVIRKNAKIPKDVQPVSGFSWTEGSVSMVIFFIVIGGLLILLVAMTAAFLVAYTARKPNRSANVSFDDCSSNSTSGTSLGSRDNISSSEVSSTRGSVNGDKIQIGSREELDTTIDVEGFGMGLSAADVSLGSLDACGLTATAAGNEAGCKVEAVEPMFRLAREQDYFSSACVLPGLTDLRADIGSFDNAKKCSKYIKKKKGKRSLRILDMFSSTSKKTSTLKKNNSRRFNFGIENNWLDLPYNFD
ncbi:protocadherin 18-like [Octopus sinensis]|uniref:Protocadherin 18-like n=1 Tax=Octopus sinensis TaxID=2607531 RepID=A0A7E6FM11_9MOLL|nr:protocadherin 18-like [Octopus sinensis]XP_036368720.1 protocadherin 18-like [Octopus sinensis]